MQNHNMSSSKCHIYATQSSMVSYVNFFQHMEKQLRNSEILHGIVENQVSKWVHFLIFHHVVLFVVTIRVSNFAHYDKITTQKNCPKTFCRQSKSRNISLKQFLQSSKRSHMHRQSSIWSHVINVCHLINLHKMFLNVKSTDYQNIGGLIKKVAQSSTICRRWVLSIWNMLKSWMLLI